MRIHISTCSTCRSHRASDSVPRGPRLDERPVETHVTVLRPLWHVRLDSHSMKRRLKKQFPRPEKKARAAMLTTRVDFAQYASSANCSEMETRKAEMIGASGTDAGAAGRRAPHPPQSLTGFSVSCWWYIRSMHFGWTVDRTLAQCDDSVSRRFSLAQSLGSLLQMPGGNLAC